MPALTRQPGGTRSCRLLPVALIACASFFQAFVHADDWGSFATVSNTSPGYLCDITDDNRDLDCIAPNPQVLEGGVVSATGVSTTHISTTYVQLASATDVLACGSGLAGAMRYTSGTMQVCDGAEWGNVGIGVPTGTIAAFAASSCPNGWSEYTPARGRFLRGIDTLAAGIDPDGTRLPGDMQDDAFKSHDHDGLQYGGGLYLNPNAGGSNVRMQFANDGQNQKYFRVAATGGAETRPKNVAVIFCRYAGFESQLAVGVATLASLSDVSVGSATNGDALVYDNGTWVPGAGGGSDNLGNHTASQTLVMAGNDITGADTVSGTSGLFSGFSGFGGVTSPQAAVDATGGSVSTTNIVLADGNAGSPALYFNNDGDTGLFRVGVNRLGLGTGGVLAAEFTNSGISTTNISATYVQLASATDVLACGAGMTGAMRYTSGTMQVCNGSEWGNVGIGVPTGTISAFAASSCPTGWSEYTPARGRFLRGIDNGAGNDPAGTRAPGHVQADELKSHTHTYGQTQAIGGGATNLRNYAGGSSFTTGATGGAETRPKNVAVIFCRYAGFESQLAVGVATLASLSDVSVGGASNGDALVYDNGTWVPGAGGGGSDNLGNHTASQTLVMAGNDIVGAGTVSATNVHGLAVSGTSGYFPTATISALSANAIAANVVSSTNISGTAAHLAEICDETGSNCADVSDGLGISTLAELSDVSASVPTDGNILKWNESSGRWEATHAAEGGFGAWETKSFNTIYQAPSDGFVVGQVQANASSSWARVILYTDASSSPSTQRATARVGNAGSSYVTHMVPFMMPVRAGDYWEAELTGSGSGSDLFWIPGGGSSSTPAGAVMAFDLASCPNGWSEYTPARGRFIRGIDNGAGNDPDGTRAPGDTQDDALQNIVGQITSISRRMFNSGNGAFDTAGPNNSNLPDSSSSGSSPQTVTFDASRVARTADETRPKNVALLYCRKD